jgi:hypothetical protein
MLDTRIRCNHGVVYPAENCVTCLREKNQQLREALECYEYDEDGFCMWCYVLVGRPHNNTCLRQLALKEIGV